MLNCPHCRSEVRLAELPHPGLFKNYRICPACGGAFTPDTPTKYRQALCILIALVSLFLTVRLYIVGDWLWPALVSYAILALLIFWGNKRIYLVPYRQNPPPQGRG